MLGVHPATLRRWATEGAISYIRGEGTCPQRRYDVSSYGLELVPGKSPRPGVFLGGEQPKSAAPPNAYKKGENGRDRITPATEAKRKQSKQRKTALIRQLLSSATERGVEGGLAV